MDDESQHAELIPLWERWTSNLPPREHIIFEFYREVVEPSDIECDLVDTYVTIFSHLYPRS